MFPGDGSLGADVAEIANCRCTVLPWLAEGEELGVAEVVAEATPPPTATSVAQQLIDIENEVAVQFQKMKDEMISLSDSRKPILSEIAELNVRITLLGKESAVSQSLRDRVMELQGKLGESQKRMKTIWQESKALEQSMRDRTMPLLYVEQPITIKAEGVPSFAKSDPRRQVIQGAVTLFEKLVGRADIDGQTVVFQKAGRGRASCEQGKATINMTTSAGTKAALHELGHALEHLSKDVQQKAIAFLDQRTAGESAQRLGDRYNRSEKAKFDKFLDPYMGKAYKDKNGDTYATEIVSMGLQKMFEDPVNFAKQDPEYFEFMYNLLRGK
jgi:hypothetical protein